MSCSLSLLQDASFLEYWLYTGNARLSSSHVWTTFLANHKHNRWQDLFIEFGTSNMLAGWWTKQNVLVGKNPLKSWSSLLANPPPSVKAPTCLFSLSEKKVSLQKWWSHIKGYGRKYLDQEIGGKFCSQRGMGWVGRKHKKKRQIRFTMMRQLRIIWLGCMVSIEWWWYNA